MPPNEDRKHVQWTLPNKRVIGLGTHGRTLHDMKMLHLPIIETCSLCRFHIHLICTVIEMRDHDFVLFCCYCPVSHLCSGSKNYHIIMHGCQFVYLWGSPRPPNADFGPSNGALGPRNVVFYICALQQCLCPHDVRHSCFP